MNSGCIAAVADMVEMNDYVRRELVRDQQSLVLPLQLLLLLLLMTHTEMLLAHPRLCGLSLLRSAAFLGENRIECAFHSSAWNSKMTVVKNMTQEKSTVTVLLLTSRCPRRIQ